MPLQPRFVPNSIGHVPVFPKFHSDRAYYNTGSCVHPRCITGLEITPGKEGKSAFTLIKWGYAAQGAGRTLAIEREVLSENKCCVPLLQLDHPAISAYISRQRTYTKSEEVK